MVWLRQNMLVNQNFEQTKPETIATNRGCLTIKEILIQQKGRNTEGHNKFGDKQKHKQTGEGEAETN